MNMHEVFSEYLKWVAFYLVINFARKIYYFDRSLDWKGTIRSAFSSGS